MPPGLLEKKSITLSLFCSFNILNCFLYLLSFKRKDISFEQLSDIMAFRVITNSTRECYRLLGTLHRKFPYIQGRFKDFISSPKNNGYSALHTSVIGPYNKKIEIQFRSNVMDEIAEYGVAAHWKYKDPKKIKEKDSKEYKWMYELLMSFKYTHLPIHIIQK